MPRDTARENQDLVLKNGLIVDGTGNKPVTGNLLIRSGRIHRISAQPIRSSGVAIDCAGRVVAPGFIDAHSHLDWHLPLKGHDDLKYPFLAQGITTVVGGNCGWAPAGLREGTRWREQVADNPISNGQLPISWDTVEELFERLQGSGTSHNLALLAGHGSSRVSIRGQNPSPLHPYESKELLRLLEIAMEQGARGVSVGLQLTPGLFARPEELKEIAMLVKHKGKILAIHPRTICMAAAGHAHRSFGEASNIAALREALDLARQTGVRLQVSHLAFLGPRTWRTAETALRLIDQALSDGLDVRFDACAVDAAVSRVSSMLSPWFLARGPAAFEDAEAVRKLRKEIRSAERQMGVSALDVCVTDISNPGSAGIQRQADFRDRPASEDQPFGRAHRDSAQKLRQGAPLVQENGKRPSAGGAHQASRLPFHDGRGRGAPSRGKPGSFRRHGSRAPGCPGAEAPPRRRDCPQNDRRHG